MSTRETAQSNFQRHLHTSPILVAEWWWVCPLSGDALFMIYWIMGRSPASQNRRLVVQGTSLLTEPVGSAARAA